MIRIVSGNRISEKYVLQIIRVIAKEISEQLTNMPVHQRGFKQYNIDVDIKINPVNQNSTIKGIFIDDVGNE